MFQNKLLNITLIILIALSLLAIVSVLTFMLLSNGGADENEVDTSKPLSGSDVQSLSINTDKITTNLSDGRMIILTLSLLAENKRSSDELLQRKVQVNDIIITTLHSQTRKDFETVEGLEAYKLLLLQRLNQIMDRGTIIDVFYIEKIIQ